MGQQEGKMGYGERWGKSNVAAHYYDTPTCIYLSIGIVYNYILLCHA